MVTLQDVARRAGVSTATVSYALRGHVMVKPATAERVRKAASELGYRPDVSAAVLAGKRRAAKHRSKPMTLGWLLSREASTRRSADFERRAEEYGYETEVIDLSRFPDGAAASRALWYRNVCGLVIASPGVLAEFSGMQGFDWSRFAVVKFTRAMPQFAFHLIRHSAFDYASRTLREVVARGYRRVAVLLGGSASEWDDDARLGAVLAFAQARLPSGVQLECLRTSFSPTGGLPAKAARWVRKYRPDCVVGFPSLWLVALREAGFAIPGQFRFASIISSAGFRAAHQSAGCDERMVEFSEMAVDLLHRQIIVGERGMPRNPQEYVIEPIWIDGDSLPGGAPV
jgi:DNA-binding LacI/PurR family transcriptional regulator